MLSYHFIAHTDFCIKYEYASYKIIKMYIYNILTNQIQVGSNFKKIDQLKMNCFEILSDSLLSLIKTQP